MQSLFPSARIARFDGDTATDQTLDKRYDAVKNGDVDIIIGTQVIAKGLDLPHLATVGIVQADSGLSLPDYASAERTFQLLSQAVGRVGRSDTPTNAIIQTYHPDHPAIVDSAAQNYAEFYARTLALRRHTNFPPFTYLLKAVCTYKTEAAAIKNTTKFAAELRKNHPTAEILGPTPAFYERVRDTYRWQIVVKSRDRAELQRIAQLVPSKNWQFELDPLSLL
jgi:primosomal protein N' (replication factor Y)